MAGRCRASQIFNLRDAGGEQTVSRERGADGIVATVCRFINEVAQGIDDVGVIADTAVQVIVTGAAI